MINVPDRSDNPDDYGQPNCAGSMPRDREDGDPLDVMTAYKRLQEEEPFGVPHKSHRNPDLVCHDCDWDGVFERRPDFCPTCNGLGVVLKKEGKVYPSLMQDCDAAMGIVDLMESIKVKADKILEKP